MAKEVEHEATVRRLEAELTKKNEKHEAILRDMQTGMKIQQQHFEKTMSSVEAWLKKNNEE